MQPRDLEYFRIIADHGHLGRAAVALGLSQPALTKSLHRLETELGAHLFERTPKGVRLTPVGEALRVRAGHVELALNHARNEVADLVAGRAGRVRLGIGPTLIELLLPAALTTLLERLPEVTVQVVSGLNDVLLAQLTRGDLDLLLCTLPDVAPQGMTLELLLDDELAVVARKGHPLASRRQIALPVLARQRWVLPSSTVLSRRALEFCLDAAGGAAPATVIETNSVPLLFAVVARTDLLSYQSLRALQSSPDSAQVRALDVPALNRQRRVGLVYRPDSYFPRAALGLMDLLRETARTL